MIVVEDGDFREGLTWLWTFTIGMARRVGFLEVFQRVWNFITSAFVVGM